MGSNLQHRICRGVDDQRPGLHMLFSELRDNLGTAGRFIADYLTSCLLFNAVNELIRKAVREDAERRINIEAHNLPVSSHRIFAAGSFLHFRIIRNWFIRLGYSLNRRYVRQAKLGHVRHVQPVVSLGDMPERI
ncbi:hypothetical protein D3C77_620650 [compost metagenome]